MGRVDAMAMGTVHVRLLGAFRVTVDGEEIEPRWPSRRAAELVQLLALTPHHQLVRDQVIDVLWPHLDAAAGAANLRKAAHYARQALGRTDAVELRQQMVVLFPHATIRTDAGDFLAAAEDALQHSDVAAALETVSLYTGALLPDARYEPWAEEPRRVLADRHLALLRLSGQWERVLEHDGLDEVAAREVMERALAGGHRHRAIAVYGRLRSTLLHELGVTPQEPTEVLYQRCLEGVTTTPAMLVGRSAELAIVDAQLGRGDRGAVLFVHGPAGIGKTTLLRETADRAVQAGWRVASVAADDPSDAYAALTSIVEQLLASDPAVVGGLGSIARSVLAQLTPALHPADEPEVPITRHQLVGAVQRLIDASADDRGVVIIVDDAHLADESSLMALAQLGDRHGRPSLLVLAYRPEAAGDGLQRSIARAARHGTSVVVELQPLVRDEVRDLVSSIGVSLDGPGIEALVDRSEGIPFFVLELCRAGASTDGQRLDAPLRDAITRRFLDLDADVLAWLRRLALVGGLLDLQSVLALSGCTDDEVVRLLDGGLASGVLLVDQGSYRFRHDLVRRALADQMPPHHRVAVHRDAARRLAELGARPGLVAHHWLEGGRPEQAVEWLLRAALDAVRLGGYAAAVAHLDTVLTHVPEHPDALRRRAAALDALGDHRALAAYAEAARVASAEEITEIRPLHALAQIKMGDPEGALRTLGDTEPQGLESRLARALTFSGAALLGATGPEMGTRLSAEGRRLALESGDPSAVVVASWSQAAAAHAGGDLRTSLHTDLHDTHALPRLAVTVFDGQLCITQRLLYGARPYDDVIQFASAFAAEATRLGAARGVAFATTLRGEAELLSGRLDAAEADLMEGWRLHRDMGATTGESFSLQRLAELFHQRGDHVRATRSLDDALAVARESNVGFHLLDRIYGTRIAFATDPSSALAAVREAEDAVCGPLETCPGCRITLAVPAAIAAARAGDLERADSYEQTCQFLAEVVMRLPAWYAALDEVRGHRCLAHGDRDAAVAYFDAAARGFAAAGHPFDRLRCEATAREVSRSSAVAAVVRR